ncbi:hypothetical protein EDC01DRAFT_747567 [Geopyxis carbonaria]|nr:hypothetical protein EDC01DRAFT_747567 [Geopyxis carbonaria]
MPQSPKATSNVGPEEIKPLPPRPSEPAKCEKCRAVEVELGVHAQVCGLCRWVDKALMLKGLVSLWEAEDARVGSGGGMGRGSPKFPAIVNLPQSPTRALDQAYLITAPPHPPTAVRCNRCNIDIRKDKVRPGVDTVQHNLCDGCKHLPRETTVPVPRRLKMDPASRSVGTMTAGRFSAAGVRPKMDASKVRSVGTTTAGRYSGAGGVKPTTDEIVFLSPMSSSAEEGGLKVNRSKEAQARSKIRRMLDRIRRMLAPDCGPQPGSPSRTSVASSIVVQQPAQLGGPGRTVMAASIAVPQPAVTRARPFQGARHETAAEAVAASRSVRPPRVVRRFSGKSIRPLGLVAMKTGRDKPAAFVPPPDG